MIIGTAYYPEHWKKERWETDAQLMREMGINTVRMGEFGWAVIEKEEGKFDFSLYEEAVALFARYGIRTIMGTPTAAPPRWLCFRYPDMYMEDRTGRKREFGSRRHYCYQHKGFREYAVRITREMGKKFGNNPHVTAWQIDNELGCEDEVRCYCEDCRKAFIVWLKEKYGSLSGLNESWGTVFWSQTYTDWEQIILPKETVVDGYTGYGHNPGLLLDFARFSSDSLIAYTKEQCDTLRQYTDKPVVHNVVSEFCDNYKLCRLFDNAGYDAYPRSEWDNSSPGRIGFYYDLTRGYKESPFWILEQQSGPCGWNVIGPTPENGELKLWSIQGAARGAEALIYFRWRTCLFGTEQFWYGILNHDGIPGQRYRELKEAISEIQMNEKIFKLPNKKQILMIYDYENKFCHEFQPHIREFQYKEEFIKMYEALLGCHTAVDIAGSKAELEEYPLVIFPFGSLAESSFQKKAEEYVREGGVLVLTAFSGLREENNQITEKTLPGIWREMAGICIEEFQIPKTEQEKRNVTGGYFLWKEKVRLVTAERVKGFEPEEHGVLSVNTYGKGRVYYIGCVCEAYDKVLQKICEREGQRQFILPKAIECIVKKDGEYMILLNHTQQEQRVSLKSYVDRDGLQKEVVIPGLQYRIVRKLAERN